MNEEEKPQPKISDVEVILIGGICLFFDAIELVLLFFALDDFWILDTFASVIAIYYWFRGVRQTWYVAMWILELIPWLGGLPLKTIGFGVTVYLDRHPTKLTTAAQKMASAKGGVKGKVGGKEAGGQIKAGQAMPSGVEGEGGGPLPVRTREGRPGGAVSPAFEGEGGEGQTQETEERKAKDKVTEEELGVKKESIAEVIDIMSPESDEEKAKQYKQAA
ncbi:MAG: hypothetical protein AAB738_00735 [Patescibacteria group bacterium]